MPIFNDTFRPHIIRELNHRKSHWHRQEVTIPNVRVTALVRTGGGYVGGNIRLGQIHGFTLGVPDVSQVNTVNQLHNLDEQGSIIGITYLGPNKNEPTPVRIPTKKNLPAPGITGVTISTQSKGGLTFKATVNFKMYGKEQYDAIYQLLFRPGNPVVIEYGHTRTEETLKDLNFFEDLDDENLGRFKKDITQQNRLPSTRTTGTICGLVTNFKIRLNQNNEYEASMDIINALEVMYGLPSENTLMSYGDLAQAASIKANFGHVDTKEYNETYDRVFQYILRDNGYEPAEKEGFWSSNLGEGSTNASQNMIALGALNQYEEAEQRQRDSGSVYGGGIANEIQKLQSFKIMPTANELYVDFEYFMNRVLDKILYESVTTTDGGCLTSIIKTPAQVRSSTEIRETTLTMNTGAGPINTSTTREERITARSIRLANTSAYTQWLNGANSFQNVVVNFEKMKYWPQLRSTNIKNVIINNESLYNDTQFPGTPNRQVYGKINETYAKKFGSPTTGDPLDPGGVIPYDISWEVYFNSNQFIAEKKKYNEQTPWSGIFVNYQLIREAFIDKSESVSEAIVKILNDINASTGGVFNLKLKYTSEDLIVLGKLHERYNLTIYDEKNAPNPKDYENVYTFFENDTSEAISYNFDFSLPQAVSSTVLANNFARNNPDVVGDAETYQLIHNGYVNHIQPLVDDFVDREIPCNTSRGLFNIVVPAGAEYALSTPEGRRGVLRNLRAAGRAVSRSRFGRAVSSVFRSSPEQTDYERNIERAEQALGEEIEEFLNFTAYIDFFPEVTKSQINRSGLLSTFPSSAKVSIKLLGIDGFRFGDLFRVKNMLPHPYDEYNIFMLTGYKHTIDDKGWFTDIDGIMIAGTPPEKDPKNLPESQTQELTQEQTDLLIRSLDITLGEVTPAPVEVQQSADSVQFVQQYNAERNRNPDQVYTGPTGTDTFLGASGGIRAPGNNQP